MALHKVFFELTRACNLDCTHCLNDSGEKLVNELEPESVLDIVRQIGDLGAKEIRFTGGEPTISPVLVRAVKLTSSMGVRTSIGTNAVSIMDEKAQELASSGLNLAIVSIEGDQPSHDAIRGKESYRRTWRGIRALLDSGIRVRVNAVAMRATRSGLPALADTCEREGLSLYIRRFIPSGRVTGQLQELLTVEEYRALWHGLQEYVERGVVDGHYRPNALGHCSVGSTGMVILPNGNVQSCGFLSDLGEPSYGNIVKEGVATVWDRIRYSAYIGSAREEVRSLNANRTDLPSTNCLAIAVGMRETLLQIRRKS